GGGLGCGTDRFAAASDPALSPPTAATGKLLDELTAGLAVAGSVHLVTGEAGVGKTALLQALADRLRAGGERVVWLDAGHRGYRGPRLIRMAGRRKLAARSGVLLIDSAERLQPEVLVRLDSLRRAATAAG